MAKKRIWPWLDWQYYRSGTTHHIKRKDQKTGKMKRYLIAICGEKVYTSDYYNSKYEDVTCEKCRDLMERRGMIGKLKDADAGGSDSCDK